MKTVIDVKSINDEISIVDKAEFSSFVLNEDGTVLLCVAQVNKNAKNKEESPNNKNYDLNGNQYKQSWGEKFNTLNHTSILVVDLVNKKHILVDKVGISLYKPFFFKSSSSIKIGCIGLQELPYKLGLIYCSNRVSYIFSYSFGDFASVVNFEPELEYGASEKLSILSPRVDYNIQNGYDCKVLFLQCNAGGPHRNSSSLKEFCFETKKCRTILDYKLPRIIEKKPDGSMAYSEIGPLFTSKFPKRCFTDNGKFIITDTLTPLNSRPVAINLTKINAISLINFPFDSCQVLDIKHNWIIAIGSTIDTLPNVYIGFFDETDMTNIKWTPIESSKKLSIHYDTFMFPSRDFPNKFVTGIWTSPLELVDVDSPTIVTAHGGPHSQVILTYYQSVALYTELGFKTCLGKIFNCSVDCVVIKGNFHLVNFVGSTGVDSDYTEALLGNIGSTDVHDLHDAIQYMIQNHHAHKDCIIINGGSHGGFLVTNISSQYPELNFMACIARNPVIDVNSMCFVTDIPDWNLAEGCNSDNRDLKKLYAANTEQLVKMYTLSPISNIDKVKVPTLLLLGNEDLRVPYSQGLHYHRLLKAFGVETYCFVYDDVHDLYKINVDFDCFLNVAKFIEKFMLYYLKNGNNGSTS